MREELSDKNNRTNFIDYMSSVNISKSHQYEEVSLDSWVNPYRDDEEMREIFLNMDRAMKYLHERGYCVKSFNPRRIKILNNATNQIRFETLEMTKDPIEQRQIIKEDIFNSSFIQVGIYSKCLPYLKREFLKDNFDQFAQFIPEGDVPYYRGVIGRGASVYFCEYAMEKVNRDLAAMESAIAGQSGVQKQMSLQNKKYDDTGINDKINDSIYKEISKGRKEAAFVSFLLFPTALLILGVIFAVIAWIASII